MRARTKPVVPVYYDFLNDDEAGTTAIKADGASKIVIVNTAEWFETHEVIADGSAPSPKAHPASTPPAERTKRPRRTKAQKSADDAAEAAAKSSAKPTNGHADPVEALLAAAPSVTPEADEIAALSELRDGPAADREAAELEPLEPLAIK